MVSSCQVVFNLIPSTNYFDIVINLCSMKHLQVVAIFILEKMNRAFNSEVCYYLEIIQIQINN